MAAILGVGASHKHASQGEQEVIDISFYSIGCDTKSDQTHICRVIDVTHIKGMIEWI